MATFWWNARTQKGEKYKASSLETLRHGLKRALKSFGHEYDITDKKCLSFAKSQKAFDTAKKDLKQCGKGHVVHRAEIAPAGKFTLLFLFKLIDIDLKHCLV